MMRVIAGTARGKNLAALPGEDVTRPTINRVKEAMFSSVQFSVPGARVLRLQARALPVTALGFVSSVEFSVADSGGGISEAVAAELFTPFFTTKAEGMGMGLNICRSIVEFHEGRLWVDANPAGGCIFRFTLPLETPRETASPAV